MFVSRRGSNGNIRQMLEIRSTKRPRFVRLTKVLEQAMTSFPRVISDLSNPTLHMSDIDS